MKAWLDRTFFPLVVRYATSRLHIVALLVLGIVLMLGGAAPSLELVGGNYTNITSALVACIICLQQVAQHAEVKDLHAENRRLQEQHHGLLEQIRARLDGDPTT